MTRPTTHVVVLAVVASMVLTTIAPATAGAAAAAGNVAVTTEDATNVTGTSATLNGNLTDLGNSSDATVSFEYWVEGDAANASSADAGTLNATGTFDANVSDLAENTTYVVVARANGSDGTVGEGEEISFTTGVDDGEDETFGQQVSRYVHELLGSDRDGPLGWLVSEWVVENNPGADDRPDHAGPDGDRGLPDRAGGPWDASEDVSEESDDGERGPPDHANNGNDESEDEDDDDDGDGDGERGPPDHANGNGNGSN